jgi:hypothetical protein
VASDIGDPAEPLFHAVRFESTVRALRLMGLGAGDPVPRDYEVFADHARMRLVGRRQGTFFEAAASAVSSIAVAETSSGIPSRQVELALVVSIGLRGTIAQLPIVPFSPHTGRTLKWHDAEARALAHRLAVALGLPSRPLTA